MKIGQKLKFTKKALSEYPEYKGAVLTLAGFKKMAGASNYVGYKVKVSYKKSYTETWDKGWFEE